MSGETADCSAEEPDVNWMATVVDVTVTVGDSSVVGSAEIFLLAVVFELRMEFGVDLLCLVGESGDRRLSRRRCR